MNDMSVVYVKESTAVEFDGGARVLARGEAWDSDHSVVNAHPDLFEAEPGRIAGRAQVERATRAPGERRAVGRPRKSAAAKKADD